MVASEKMAGLAFSENYGTSAPIDSIHYWTTTEQSNCWDLAPDYDQLSLLNSKGSLSFAVGRLDRPRTHTGDPQVPAHVKASGQTERSTGKSHDLGNRAQNFQDPA